MSDRAAIERSRRAQSALEEFVGPACEAARADYLAAMTQIAVNEPWATDKITKLAVAQNVIDMVEQHLRVAISEGKEAQRIANRAEQIALIPEHKRNLLKRMGMRA